MQNNNTLIRLVLPAVCGLAGLLGMASKAQAQTACSVATLSGSYAVSSSGSYTAGSPVGVGPFAAVGRFVADGRGGFTLNEAINANGNVLLNQSQTGTYTMGSDCSGDLTFSTGEKAHIVLADGGKSFRTVYTLPAYVVGTGTGALQ